MKNIHSQFGQGSKKLKFVVQLKEKGKEHNYPVSRMNDHTTFLACITSDGNYLNPLIAIKSQTVDIRLCHEVILDKILLPLSECRFINSNIFDEWLEKHIVPYIHEMHDKHMYNGTSSSTS